MRSVLAILLVSLIAAAGCGTTRWTDTTRTATEQLLISDAIDRAVSNFDLRALAGKTIYLDTTRLKTTVDADYLVSSLRQHALASGCILKAKIEEADYVVEIRSGAVGTDRHDALFGIPATNVPANTFTGGVPAAVPEVSLWKKTDQRAVAKVALFAYNRETGRPVWQSGLAPVESSAKAVWVMGAGPFRRGHIHEGMDFAGEPINLPLVHPGQTPERPSVATEAYFSEPPAAEIARRLPSVATPAAPQQPNEPAPGLTPGPEPGGPMPPGMPGQAPPGIPQAGVPTPNAAGTTAVETGTWPKRPLTVPTVSSSGAEELNSVLSRLGVHHSGG